MTEDLLSSRRILIVDDHEAVRSGLRSLLSSRPDLSICGEAVDGLDAITQARQLLPDLILMDISMPRMNGLDATRRILQEFPASQIVVISQNEPSVACQQASAVGAAAFVPKSSLADNLFPAIDKTLARLNQIDRHPGEFAPNSINPSRPLSFEETLQAKQRRLQLATDAGEIGIWHWYPDGDRATWENDRMYEIFGRSREDGPFNSVEFGTSIVHPDDREPLKLAVQKAVDAGVPFSFEARVFRKDGSLRWIQYTGQVDARVNGNPLRYLGTARDITDRKLSEDALRQHRSRFDLVAEACQVGFWFCDLPFDELIWDSRVKEHFWLPSDAHVTIHTFYERLHPDDRERTRLAIEFSNANDTPYDIEYRTVAPDGRTKWIRALGRTFYDSSRQPIRFDGITLDITARKSVDDALIESEQRLRLAQKAARSGTWDRSLSADGHIVVSPELEELWGLPPGTIATHGDAILRQRMLPEDLVQVDQTLARAIATKNPEFRAEFRITRADGALRWLETVSQLFFDSAGNAIRVVGITSDITDRKQIQERERLMAAEALAATAKFRAVFEQTPVFAGIASLDGVIIDANQLCLTACGYKSEQVLGLPFWETPWWRMSPETQAKIRIATQQAAQGIASRQILTYHWADGSARVVDFSIHPIVDETGQILFLHPTGVDITDLKQAEENYRLLAESLEAEVRARTLELQKQNFEVTRQSELVRTFSQRLLQAQEDERRHIARELHDSAGQTLTVLGMNLAQLIQKAGRTAPDLAALAETIQQSVQQLSREIRTASYLLHPPLLDENGLFSALHWYIQGLTERSGLDISLDISENLGRLPRDMELVVFRLVQECLTNVHRHSGSKTASIRISRQPSSVSIEVRDQGHGMSFEKLSELHAGGSGVGIRGMRERLRQFDGKFHIESSPSGTHVQVIIPIPKSPTPSDQPTYQSQQAAV